MKQQHDQMVRDFLKSAQHDNPQKYAEVCARNPVLSPRQIRRIREHETRLTSVIAHEYGIESSYDDDNDYA